MPIQLLFSSPSVFLAWAAAIVFAITVHEFSHALVGHLQGDPTPEQHGRLTLNPLAHIDWIGFGLLMLAGFGWGRPVPFNPYNLKFKRFGPALVGLAGPAMNLLMVVVFAIVLRLLAQSAVVPTDSLLFTFIVFLVEINVVLMVFNLIPIPPLDGSKLLYSFLGVRHLRVIAFLEQYGIWLLFGLVLLASPLLSAVFDAVLNLVYSIALR